MATCSISCCVLQAGKRAKRAQQAKSELQQMNLMHSWLTSKPTSQPFTRLHLQDIDQNSLKRLFRQLSRALQPWKELYISSACAQATFVLTAQVCSLIYHITTMLPWGDANLACLSLGVDYVLLSLGSMQGSGPKIRVHAGCKNNSRFSCCACRRCVPLPSAPRRMQLTQISQNLPLYWKICNLLPELCTRTQQVKQCLGIHAPCF